MRFESKRLYLRELVHEDVTEEYLHWFKDEQVTEFLQAKNLTVKEVKDYIDFGNSTKGHFLYAICDKDNDKHIGNLKIGPIDWKNRISDLVVVIGDRDYWGKGLATEIIAVGNAVAFGVHDLRKVTGGMYEENIGSIKCYTRAGWVIEGRLNGHYLLDGKSMDRVLVSCFNPKYFSEEK